MAAPDHDAVSPICSANPAFRKEYLRQRRADRRCARLGRLDSVPSGRRHVPFWEKARRSHHRWCRPTVVPSLKKPKSAPLKQSLSRQSARICGKEAARQFVVPPYQSENRDIVEKTIWLRNKLACRWFRTVRRFFDAAGFGMMKRGRACQCGMDIPSSLPIAFRGRVHDA